MRLSSEHERFRDTLRSFVAREVVPHLAARQLGI
jgi:hypothetical protein